MNKIWFITGSSRGLGRSLTSAVLASGDKVAATARNTDQLKDLAEQYPHQLYPIKLEVTNESYFRRHNVYNCVSYHGR